MKRSPALTHDVTRVLDRWHPEGWVESDLRALDAVRPTVRDWVVKAAPRNPHVARRLLRTTALLSVWAYRTWGTTDVTVVLDPRNVEHWVMGVNSHRSPAWRENARGALRTVGRAAYPTGWPAPPPQVGRTTVASPYDSIDETAFVRAAKLAGRFNRAARLWVVGGAFGGGLYGQEITAATTRDLEKITGGRLVFTTRGPKARMVPIRRAYTKLVAKRWNTLTRVGLSKLRDGTLFTGSAPNSTPVTERVCRCDEPAPPGCMPIYWPGHHCRHCDGSPGRCPPTPWTSC